MTITPAGGQLLSELSPGSFFDPGGSSSSPVDSPARVAVSTDFFSSGGFASINLTAAGITLPANVSLNPVVSSLLRIDTPGVTPSSPSLGGLVTPTALAVGARPPAAISLHATGDLWNIRTHTDPSADGLIIDGTIVTDPKGSVTLVGDQIAVVRGVVNAPAGNISLSGGTYVSPDSVLNGPSPVLLDGEGVWLTGSLLATGTKIAVPQSNNRLVFSDVLAGGTVTLSGGDIILAPGSTIDVSGASGHATLAAAGVFGFGGGIGAQSAVVTSTVWSAGGTISISAVLGAVLEGTLVGRSGGGNAAGGTLQVSLTPHSSCPRRPAA
jgi:hypothetical protein